MCVCVCVCENDYIIYLEFRFESTKYNVRYSIIQSNIWISQLYRVKTYESKFHMPDLLVSLYEKVWKPLNKPEISVVNAVFLFRDYFIANLVTWINQPTNIYLRVNISNLILFIYSLDYENLENL